MKFRLVATLLLALLLGVLYFMHSDYVESRALGSLSDDSGYAQVR